MKVLRPIRKHCTLSSESLKILNHAYPVLKKD